ncbi:MAG: DNA methyltransferase [Rhizobiaceae bacterium]|nr:DNA methyltransferase [Rhizobiaceae bacterium]
MQHPNVSLCPIEKLVPYIGNARTHSKEQIALIAKSIERFGFTNPVLVDDAFCILGGHGRVEAAKQLGLEKVPIILLSHLSEDERRAYILADNKIAEQAGWDNELLAIELQGLMDIDFDLELTGFSTTEIDIVLDEQSVGLREANKELDSVPTLEHAVPVTQTGDLWRLGNHLLLCGDAQKEEDVERLCVKAKIDLLITDPPYNVPINGNVTGLGAHKHREFAFASGEMSSDQFTSFLQSTLSNASKSLKDGAIAFVFMDWRHMRELQEAGDAAFDELKNLCVWNKSNAGMGTFYRSKHELVFVFKKGRAPHTNTFRLGETGRYRTNVWDYAGANVWSETRLEDLAMHPTVKPVEMIADAIKDCTKQGETVLDIFGGSGSTLIAAEVTERKARILELDPIYCDTIIRRFEKLGLGNAELVSNNKTFAEIVEERLIADIGLNLDAPIHLENV